MLKTVRKNVLDKVDKKDLHYKVVSLVPLEGVDISLSYRVSPITYMKFNKEKISLQEYKAEYNRQLDARGKHLIEGDLRDYVLTCDCENKVHKGHCAVRLLKSYVGIKEDIQTSEDLKKVDYLKEFEDTVVEASRCPKCNTVLEVDDETGMYCPKCDDVVSFEDLES